MGKGATELIKIDEVRQEIDSTYPNPGSDAEGELEAENSGYSHKLIGSSFEFLCRLQLYRECREVVIPHPRYRGKNRWGGNEIPPTPVTVFDGMRWEDYNDISSKEEWEEMKEDLPVWKRPWSAVKWTENEELSKLAAQYVETGMNTEGVVKAALLNAGWKPSENVHSWINRDAFEEDLLEEMEGLFSLLREQDWTSGDVVFEKPTFGEHRYILLGEGDFIVDDLLLDIKTTQNRSFTNLFWRQLLIYYVLSDIQRILCDVDGRTYGNESFEEKYPKIKRVGIYFARFGELKTVDLEEVIDDQERYEEFRAWVVDRAIEENQHGRYDYSAIRAALTEPYDYERQQTLSDF